MSTPPPHRPPPPVPAGDPQDGPPNNRQDERIPEAAGGSSGVYAETAKERLPDVVGDNSVVSTETAIDRKHNMIKMLVEQFLGIPFWKSEASFEVHPTTGLEKGFLNYFSRAPISVSFSSEQETGPSKFEQFSDWFMKNVDPEDIYLKKFVKMVYELNNISIGEVSMSRASVVPILAGPFLNPSLRAFMNSMKAMQKQIPQIQKSVSKVEITSAEGVEVLAAVRDTTLRIETLLKEAAISVENLEKKGTTRGAVESVAETFVQRMKQIEDNEISVVLKQVDKLSQLADIPVSMKKRLEEMSNQMKLLKAMLAGTTGAWGVNAVKPASVAVPIPSHVDTANPDAPALKRAFVVPVLPFHKVGKVAADILNQNYLGELPHRCELSCLFGKDLNYSIGVKVSSVPDVRSVLRHQEIWGESKLRGDVRLVLPFKNRIDEAGAVVPVEKTCLARVIYLHERACLSSTVGLHRDPFVTIAGMLGGSASILGTTSFCGGGRLMIQSADGSVTGLDAALSVSNPEWWGTASLTATLLEGNRGLNVLYNQKVLQKSTLAAQLEYNHQDGSVVACVGVEHKYDRAVKLKAMVRTNGIAQALVETKEGIAGSRVCASVRVNLRQLDQPPQVGFSISTNPTWG